VYHVMTTVPYDPKCDLLIRALSVADPDPGSGAFLTPGSGIRNRFFSDPFSDRTHIFEVKFFG
jgi:hypothetical protein